MTLYEYFSVFGSISAAVIAMFIAWMNMRIKAERQDVKIEGLEKSHDEYSTTLDKIFDKLDEINRNLNNKQDKKRNANDNY